MPSPRHAPVRGTEWSLSRNAPVPLPCMDVCAGRPTRRGAAYGRTRGLRETGSFAESCRAGAVGRIHFSKPRERSDATREGLRAARRKIHALELAEPPLRAPHPIRRTRELETDLRKLFRVLPLS